MQHALSLGAVDFIREALRASHLLKARLDHQLMMLEAEAGRDRGGQREHRTSLLGDSPCRCRGVRDAGPSASRTRRFPVLVQGESGTGKELVAELLHAAEQAARPSRS